jgi:putative methionine-R-sulfoxide reductase with GAF domain
VVLPFLHTQDKTLKKAHPSPRVLVAEAKRVLDSWRPSDRHSPLDEVLELLEEGRRYESQAVYLVLGDRVKLVSRRGNAPASDSLAFGESNIGSVATNGITKSKDISVGEPKGRPELAVPIKLAARVLGVLDVESSRLSSSDNILVHEVAHLIARFLTSNGKHLVRKAREAAGIGVAESVVKPYRATSDKNAADATARRAAAGEASRA